MIWFPYLFLTESILLYHPSDLHPWSGGRSVSYYNHTIGSLGLMVIREGQ